MVGIGYRTGWDIGINIVIIKVVYAGLNFIKMIVLPWACIYIAGSILVFMFTS